jgi:diadenosine tetraphosphate (Ap4A) HIT family hydrolase
MSSAHRWPAADDDCLFCSVNQDPADRMEWYDRPLWRADGVGVAIPALGAFVPGYVLATPAHHLSSVQGLPTGTALEFLDFLGAVVDAVTTRYGPCTLFEHGSCQTAERRRSACITHAHVHVVPGRYGMDGLGLVAQAFENLDAFASQPVQQRLDGYLMYQEADGPVQYAADLGLSQFFRRHIATVLGAADDWDYAVFPNWDNIRQTVHDLTSSPIRMRI